MSRLVKVTREMKVRPNFVNQNFHKKFKGRGRQSKSEKKARKAMAKLSLRAIPGVNRVCIRLILILFRVQLF